MGSAKWEVIDENWGSDHGPVLITSTSSVKHVSKFNIVNRLHGVKSDWTVIIKNFINQENNLEALIKNESIDTQVKYSTFIATICDCVLNGGPSKEATPLSKAKEKPVRQQISCLW